MSELTLTIIRLGLLVLLWIFVFSVVGVLRGDLYGTRVVSRTPRKPAPAGRRGEARGPAPATPQKRSKRQPHSTAPRTLVVTGGALTGTSLPLREAGTIIGRNPECALVLDDDFASGRHVAASAQRGRAHRSQPRVRAGARRRLRIGAALPHLPRPVGA